MRILLFLVWLILGFVYWFVWDRQQEKCCEQQVGTEVIRDTNTVESGISAYPIQFKWADKQAETTSLFSTYKDSLFNLLSAGGKLEITGFYADDELKAYPQGTDLGLMRAQEIREKLFPELKEGQFSLYSKKHEQALKDTELAFSASSIAYKPPENISTISDKILHFPFSSYDVMVDDDTEEYLDLLKKWMKETSGTIEVTGHTDNVGAAEINYNVGLKRAEYVKAYLVQEGIPGNRIVIRSEGKLKPVASNETEEGRAKNRRAEIKTIQN